MWTSKKKKSVKERRKFVNEFKIQKKKTYLETFKSMLFILRGTILSKSYAIGSKNFFLFGFKPQLFSHAQKRLCVEFQLVRELISIGSSEARKPKTKSVFCLRNTNILTPERIFYNLMFLIMISWASKSRQTDIQKKLFLEVIFLEVSMISKHE